MQYFFTIIKTEPARDYSVTVFERENLLTLVEDAFGGDVRAKCENETINGIKGLAWNYLSGKYQMIELYDYDLAGAMRFMAAAHGVGRAQGLQAIKLVQALRDGYSRVIDEAMDRERATIIENLATGQAIAHASAHMQNVRMVLDSDADELLRMVARQERAYQ
jgi:hypothetical protein